MTIIPGPHVFPGRVRARPPRLLGGILVALVALHVSSGPARADVFSDGWNGLRGAVTGPGRMAYSGMEKLMPLEFNDLVIGKGCSFKIISGHDFGGEQATYKFVGPCKYRVEPGKQHAKPYEVTFDLEVEGLWSAPLASELVVGRQDGKTTFGAQVSYTCPVNPWKTGQSCQRTDCASATTKGCEGLDTLLQRAGNKDQPMTRIVGAVTAGFSAIKIASPMQGASVPDTKPLGVTITLPFGQKVQYELTSPAGSAYSQILGPVYGLGKLDEKTFVVASVPPATLKPRGQWTMTAHLIGVANAALTQQQITFTVTHTATAQSGAGQAPLAPGPVRGRRRDRARGRARDRRAISRRGRCRRQEGPGPRRDGRFPHSGSFWPSSKDPRRSSLQSAMPTGSSRTLSRPSSSAWAASRSDGDASPGWRWVRKSGSRSSSARRPPRAYQVDVEVWIGGRRLGSARVTPLARTP